MRILITCLAFILCAHGAMSQEMMLQGKIINQSTNEPIAGATISTSPDNATLTNQNGEFQLPITDGYQSVTIAAEGFATQTVF